MPDKNFENIVGQITPIDTARVLRDVAAERERQTQKWGLQTHPDGTNEALRGVARFAIAACEAAFDENKGTWRDILAEEVAEAFAEEDLSVLRKELVQVAAVCAAWIEDIDFRAAE